MDARTARWSILGAAIVGLVWFGTGARATSQPGSPAASPPATPGPTQDIALIDAAGGPVGRAILAEAADGRVAITVLAAGLPPGEHGIHVHAVGVCDPAGGEPFASAAGHFDPTDGAHGAPDGPESHAGDLGNLEAGDDGRARLETDSTKFTLSPGPVTLADADGSALVIHAQRDDLATDPAGNSGPRLACGVIAAPIATPTAATPAPGP